MALALCATVIVACDSGQDTAAPPDVQGAVPPREAPVEPPQERPPTPEESSPAGAAPEQIDIDLSLPPDTWSADTAPVEGVGDGKPVLPNLFATPDKKQKTRINAELFRDEENPDVIDSIEGMNVTIERKLGD